MRLQALFLCFAAYFAAFGIGVLPRTIPLALASGGDDDEPDDERDGEEHEHDDGDDHDGPGRGVSLRLLTDRYIAEPGETIDVVLGLTSEEPIELVAFSVKFDAGRLEFLEALLDPAVPSGPGTELEVHYKEDRDRVQGVLEIEDDEEAAGEEQALPAGQDVPIVILRFQVKAGAPEGPAEFNFALRENTEGPSDLSDEDREVFNTCRGNERRLPGQEKPRFDGCTDPDLPLDPLRISILGDIGLFSRGDANGDHLLDVSDSVHVLDYLYQGGPPPVTFSAGDANGDLSIDLSDALAVLFNLFFGIPLSG